MPNADCQNWACMMGMCVSTFDPAGTVVNDPTNGDCKANVCDGMGNVVPGDDNSDTPSGDGNPCTTGVCNNGMPMQMNHAVGSNCGNGNVCNSMGMCVDCANDGDCNGGDVCNSMGTCVECVVDGDCNGNDVCNNMSMCVQCVVDTDCKVGTNPTCVQSNCISCSDGIKNGDEVGVDCGGTKCTKKCDGAACAMAADCKSNFCADGVCCNAVCTGTCLSCNLAATVGVCTNIPLNGTDDAPMCDGTEACNGAGLCKLVDGQPCANMAECLSNKCMGMPMLCVP